MVDMFEFGVNTVEELITILFLNLYFGDKFTGIKKYAGFILCLAISVATISVFNALYLFEGILGLTFIVIYFTYREIFLDGSRHTKLFLSGFVNSVTYFVALFSNLVTSIIFDDVKSQLYGLTFERVVMVALSKLLLILICIFMLKHRPIETVSDKHMIILIVMPIVVELSMIGIMRVFLRYSELRHELLFATSGVLMINILIYYVYIKINNNAKTQAELLVLKQRYEYDKEHSREIEKLYTETCGIRHDLINHFTTIARLVGSDNEAALEYIQSVTREQLNKFKVFSKTDNECFDAIVNSKLADCEKFGIHVSASVMNGSLEKLESEEIGVLFGNLFDNAIEAAKEAEDKLIELRVQTQDEHLSIFMKNSIGKSVLKNNSELKSTKKDSDCHGLGTKNIGRIVEKYEGIINYFEEDGCFCCDILI